MSLAAVAGDPYDLLECAILRLGQNLEIDAVNRFGVALLGYDTPDAIIHTQLRAHLHADEQRRDLLPSIFNNVKAQGVFKHVELDLLDAKGDKVPMVWNISFKNDQDSDTPFFHLVGMEISSYRKISEEADMFRNVVANHVGPILITDAKKGILFANNAATRVTGYSEDELVGVTPSILRSGKTPDYVYAEMREALSKGDVWKGELINRRKYGELFKETKSITPIRDANGTVQYYFSISEDQGSKAEYEQQIDYLLYFDSLTGLLNQSGFLQSLASAVDAANAEGKELAVLSIDIDGFTKVSSMLGVEDSDALIVNVGKRIKESLRHADLIARTGRDSFAIMLYALEVGAEADSKEVADRILMSMRSPFILQDQSINISASIGIACYPQEGSDAQQILSNAIRTSLAAKDEGGDMSRLFKETSISRSASGLRDLWYAPDRGEMILYYQPQVSLYSGEIVGLEALIRWQHPVRGLLSPVEFLPQIENSPHIVKIGEWVINEVGRQMRYWIDAGLAPIKVAINLSARHFRMPNLHEAIADAMQKYAIVRGKLEIEITESVMMQDINSAIQSIGRLREMGVRISLDDFGTGFSSMTYLSRLPVDNVKIDKSFVRDITTNQNNAAIAQATIAVAHKLGKRVIAEGVETVEQMQFLRRNECDEMQGYLFSKPRVPEEVFNMLKDKVALNVVGEFQEDELDCILLVDDEPAILSSLKRILRRENYHILTANSASEGFSLMAQHPVKLIVCDQRMPDMSGTKYLSQIKAMYPKTVRMILSGYSDISVVTEAVNDGAVYRYLSKPWQEDELKESIRNGLRYWRELYGSNEALAIPFTH